VHRFSRIPNNSIIIVLVYYYQLTQATTILCAAASVSGRSQVAMQQYSVSSFF